MSSVRNRSVGPRFGTRPYMALKALHQLGGSAFQMEWMCMAGCSTSASRFEIDVVYYLVNSGMVTARSSAYGITPAGLNWLGAVSQGDGKPSAPAQVAGPRYVPEKRPLSVSNMARPSMARPGSFDYAAIPSRMGDQRVPHGLAIPGVMGAIVSE